MNPTTVYANRARRDRVNEVRLPREERRVVTIDLNGAIDPARTVTAATWETINPQTIRLTATGFGSRSLSATIEGVQVGAGYVRVLATLDNDERLVETLRVEVR